MGAMYGKRCLNALEIKGAFRLSNGMYCVYGHPSDEGISVDIYRDKSKSELISMQHGIITNSSYDDHSLKEMLQDLMESMIDEF